MTEKRLVSLFRSCGIDITSIVPPVDYKSEVYLIDRIFRTLYITPALWDLIHGYCGDDVVPDKLRILLMLYLYYYAVAIASMEMSSKTEVLRDQLIKAVEQISKDSIDYKSTNADPDLITSSALEWKFRLNNISDMRYIVPVGGHILLSRVRVVNMELMMSADYILTNIIRSVYNICQFLYKEDIDSYLTDINYQAIANHETRDKLKRNMELDVENLIKLSKGTFSRLLQEGFWDGIIPRPGSKDYVKVLGVLGMIEEKNIVPLYLWDNGLPEEAERCTVLRQAREGGYKECAQRTFGIMTDDKEWVDEENPGSSEASVHVTAAVILYAGKEWIEYRRYHVDNPSDKDIGAMRDKFIASYNRTLPEFRSRVLEYIIANKSEKFNAYANSLPIIVDDLTACSVLSSFASIDQALTMMRRVKEWLNRPGLYKMNAIIARAWDQLCLDGARECTVEQLLELLSRNFDPAFLRHMARYYHDDYVRIIDGLKDEIMGDLTIDPSHEFQILDRKFILNEFRELDAEGDRMEGGIEGFDDPDDLDETEESEEKRVAALYDAAADKLVALLKGSDKMLPGSMFNFTDTIDQAAFDSIKNSSGEKIG